MKLRTCLLLVLVGFLYGFSSHKWQLFPAGLLRSVGEKLTPKKVWNYPAWDLAPNPVTKYWRGVKSGLSRFGLPLCHADKPIWIGDSLVEFRKTQGEELNFGANGLLSKNLSQDIAFFRKCPHRAAYLYIGGNDLDRGIPTEQVFPYYKNIVDNLREFSPMLHLLGLHRGKSGSVRNRFVDELNKKIESLADDKRVLFIPSPDGFYDELGFIKAEFASDGEHLTQKGYRLWNRHVREFVLALQALG